VRASGLGDASLIPVLEGDNDTRESLTFAVVARAEPSQSLARTLGIAVPGIFEDALA
jgi:hypothetical protein